MKIISQKFYSSQINPLIIIPKSKTDPKLPNSSYINLSKIVHFFKI